MIRRVFRRCGNALGAISPEDQAAVDAFRVMLAARKNPQPWTPGCDQDVAVRVGPFVERAQPRPGDDHGPDLIAVTLVHPDTPSAAAYLHGHQLGYTGKGWLRCETNAILGIWQPAYAMLTHAAADLPLPDDVGMSPAHYGVHVEARRSDNTGYTLLRLGPYTQTWHRAGRQGSHRHPGVHGHRERRTVQRQRPRRLQRPARDRHRRAPGCRHPRGEVAVTTSPYEQYE
ncbi:hypothetical protein SAMN04487980_10547 [Streptomyces sp. cf124]|uniref:hypothetical protein n=1 Tax=Streptomyces sp. cf124 TaxID=1761903 RepID=UPI0008DF1782|nr:hypothetical protein [Streptomyces sp. cf124]SFO07015.1 hypothetical protein SAMN04487980_10547 [Streptomyces sp. cf124]